MTAPKLYLVTVQDTVVQATGYLVRATEEDVAKALVVEGKYIEETSTVTLDNVGTSVINATEISQYGEGQERFNQDVEAL